MQSGGSPVGVGSGDAAAVIPVAEMYYGILTVLLSSVPSIFPSLPSVKGSDP
jgi:hypothetical protein